MTKKGKTLIIQLWCLTYAKDTISLVKIPRNTGFYHSTKKRQHSFHILKSFFSSDTHQSIKTSDSDLKVNRNIYPDAVNVVGCERSFMNTGFLLMVQIH